MQSSGSRSNDIDSYCSGIKKGDRVALARAITLIESNSVDHFQQAQQLVKRLLPFSGKSIRLGITGAPGAGKSTLIEALGRYLLESGQKVAVLAIDPSSSKSGGSILGDKTRMDMLSRSDAAFIRPSPSGGELGGVTRQTRESIVLCEAAGYDVVLVETMGVGQGETEVRSMVDFFLLLQIAGAGDELQGIKKGVIEMADAIVVNKADGVNQSAAENARGELKLALHYLASGDDDWRPPVLTCSAQENKGIKEIWKVVQNFVRLRKESHLFEELRKKQEVQWLRHTVNTRLVQMLLNNSTLRDQFKKYEDDVRRGKQTAAGAAMLILKQIKSQTGLTDEL